MVCMVWYVTVLYSSLLVVTGSYGRQRVSYGHNTLYCHSASFAGGFRWEYGVIPLTPNGSNWLLLSDTARS